MDPESNEYLASESGRPGGLANVEDSLNDVQDGTEARADNPTCGSSDLGKIQSKNLIRIRKSEEEVIELIALHLACTRELHHMMGKTPTQLSSSTLRREWISSIDLAQGECGVGGNLLDQFHTGRLSGRVLARATEIWNEVPNQKKERLWEMTIAPAPVYNPEWNDLREDLFRYHELRRRHFDSAKQIEKQRHNITGSGRPPNSLSQDEQNKVSILKKAERELWDTISNTKFETVIVQEIDHLLLSCFTDEVLPELGYPGGGLQVHAEAIKWVMNRYSFQPNYVDGQKDANPFESVRDAQVKQPPLLDPFFSKQIPVFSTVLSCGSLAEHDSRLTQRIPLVLAEIDIDLFKSNLQGFLNTKTRLDHLQATAPRKTSAGFEYSSFKAGELSHAELLHDNLVHAHKLFELLQSDEVFDYNSSVIQKTWLQLMAVLAICYGCTSESAFFLTTMDRLLSKLRDEIGKYSLSEAIQRC
jgi:hypothetical protein